MCRLVRGNASSPTLDNNAMYICLELVTFAYVLASCSNYHHAFFSSVLLLQVHAISVFQTGHSQRHRPFTSFTSPLHPARLSNSSNP
jgi:hypothetical protein